MQQALLKCEMPRLELKSSRSFLAIKRCQWTKNKKLLSDHEARQKSWRICAPLVVKLLMYAHGQHINVLKHIIYV